MNSIFASSSAFGVASPFGGSSVFGTDGTCSCHGIVDASRNLVSARVSQTRLASEAILAPRSRGDAIPWEGNAASLFRQRLNQCAVDARLVEHNAQTVLSLCWGA
ncbi:hypothetical protein [Bifidobacterium biavatii]|nr:hypothetical protein [Bifidobacterium biavatii]